MCLCRAKKGLPLKRLFAIALAFVVAGAPIAAAATGTTIELENEIRDAPYQIWPAKARSNSPDFVKAAIKQRNEQGDNCKVVLGTSEFRWAYPETVSSHPANFFANHNYGMDTFLLGQPYCQDLWHAVEVGAISDAIPDDKVVFFCGMTWFMDYQDPAGCFREAFSEEAYRAMMNNPSITDKTKEKILNKMIAYGIDESVVFPDRNKKIVERVNDAALRLVDTTKNWDSVLSDQEDTWNAPERELNKSRPVPSGRFGEEEVPDWEAWLESEKAEGAEQSSSNEYGVYNSWYEKGGCDKWLKGAQESWSFPEGQPYQETEIEDFRLFLDVCKETGIEPLVVLMPVKGALFDQTAYDQPVRTIWFDKMKAICDEYGVQYVDFQQYEYDPYFLYDMAHFGWTGWVHVNKAIYEFFMGDGDE